MATSFSYHVLISKTPRLVCIWGNTAGEVSAEWNTGMLAALFARWWRSVVAKPGSLSS